MTSIGELYAIDCSRADSPRVRLSAKSFDIEFDNKRLSFLNPQEFLTYYGGKPPPEFENAIGGLMQPDVGAVFIINRDKRGQYMTVRVTQK